MRRTLAVSLYASGVFLIGAMGLYENEAMAQGADGSRLEEITVTARRRDESLMDVPISITALSAEQLENYNLQDMEEISRMTPGMFYSDWGGTGRQDRASSQFVIRGLAVNSFQSLSDAAILFIDGVPSVSGNLPGSLDIARIEVLKGPQTAAFGRNTFSGAISVTTKDPGDTFGGSATLELANFDSSQVGLSVEGPLVQDKVFGRISFEQRTEGAQYRNSVNGQPLGGQDTTSVWGSLKFVPTDNLEIKLVANYYEFEDDWGAQVRLVAADNNCDPGNSGANTWFCGNVPTVVESDTRFLGIDQRWRDITLPFRDVTINDGQPGLVAKNVHVNAQISYEFTNGWVLNSLTGYNEEIEGNIASEWYDPNNLHNFLAVPGVRQETSWIYLLQGESEDFSQEFRLSNAGDGRLAWSVGANYVKFESVGGLIGDVPLPFASLGWSPTSPVNLPGGLRESTTTSVFGSVYYDVTDKIELGFEARYQEDDISDIDDFWSDNPLPELAGTWTAFTPRVSVSYKPNDDVTIFGTFSQGQRPGAFNASLQSGGPFTDPCIAEIKRQTGAGLEADQEEIDSFDLGVKANFAGGRGSMTATVYAGKITNQQVNQSITLTQPCLVINTFITNVGESEFSGIELDGSYQLTDNLTISGAYAYNDVEITQGEDRSPLNFGGSSDVIGNALPRTPNSSAFAGIQYRGQLNGVTDWYVGGEILHAGRKFVTVANLLEVPSQELVNARVGIEKDAWRIELWGKNLFDDDTPDLANPSFDYNTFTSRAITIGLPKKRSFGVRANLQF
jgi:iron complex outermembrane receptor protein